MSTQNRKHISLTASLPGGNGPPSEFLIWAFGAVKTTKGTFLFDEEGAQSVMRAYAAYGNRLTIDYEHKAVDPNRRAGDGKAAGSFQIELRADGLYAIDVRWTPPAAHALTNKEWLYFSPYFAAEEDSGRIVELINLALTNIPATTHMQPLVAAQRSPFQMADDVVNQTNETLASDDEDDVEASAKAAAKKSARDRLAKARAELDAATAECSAFGEDDEEEGEDDETTARAASAAATPTASPGAAVAATSRGGKTAASRIVAVARALTGKDDEGEIVGALTALSDATRTNVALSKRVGDLERRLRKSDVESMVTRAIKAGKLTPAEREWALSYGMESPAKLRGYLDVTPPRANIAGAEHREPALRPGESHGATLAVALSDEERRICQNTGVDPAKFAAVKHRPIRVG